MSSPNSQNAESDSGGSYNPVFEKLVDNIDNPPVEGLVAYGLYKASKRQWTLGVIQRTGRKPDATDLEHWKHAQTDIMLQSYRQQANQLLGNYASSVVEDQRATFVKDALKGSLWHDIKASVLGSLIFTLILVAFAIVAQATGLPAPLDWIFRSN